MRTGMKRSLRIAGILIIVATWFAIRGRIGGFNTIEYHGQTVKLSKPYFDDDDYKNDPNNLAAEEVPRVQELVKSAAIAKRFPSREGLIRAIFDVNFPGYGLGSYATASQQDGSTLELWGVEVPQAESTRFFLFRGRGGAYDLVDDFVQTDEPMIANVGVVGDRFVYSTQQGAKVVERAGSVR
jgi:hypothetical protein